MYQFYYSQYSCLEIPKYKYKVNDVFHIKAIRPTMWEEHCLECSVPLCYGSCRRYEARIDGRCKLFYDGIAVRPEALGCSGQAARVRFRQWGNMMTIIFPGMEEPNKLRELTEKNQKLGRHLHVVAYSRLPVKIRWNYIRIKEYMRRRKLRNYAKDIPVPDAFIFHGYSFESSTFRLMLDFYRESKSVFRTSLEIQPGENLHILNRIKLSPECWKPGNLMKVYPENNLEADIEILWAEFVLGEPIKKEAPAEKVKCVVWDLDNTFWNGTLVETEDPDTLQPLPGVLAALQAFDAKGILQSVASKNNYEEVWPVLQRLGVTDYFLYPQINWGAKSASIRAIADSLNIGIDSIALLDDSSFERFQVSTMLPQVRTYDPAELTNVLERPEFDVPATSESAIRRQMYRAEEKRNALKESSMADTIEFLKSCHMCVRIFIPQTQEELLRCYELTNRTNQLNMSGVKYSSEEFQKMLKRGGHTNFAFSCEDDFGTYGIVGFGQYRIEKKTLFFTEFAMSCRIAGKYVESALFSALLDEEKCSSGRFAVKKTKKNGLLRRTLEEIGFRVSAESPEDIQYRFDSSLINKNLVKAVIAYE